MKDSSLVRKERKNVDVLEVLHSDIMGTIQKKSDGASRYTLTILGESKWCISGKI